MMLIEDVIKKLPKMFQALARAHLKALTKLSLIEVTAWTMLMLEGDYEQAHKSLIAFMDTSDLIEDTKALKSLLSRFNRRSKAEADMWRNFFLTILTILLSSIEEEIVDDVTG